MPATAFRIAIIGAGPGGLVCAGILQRYGVPVTVFERDPGPTRGGPGGPSPCARRPGWRRCGWRGWNGRSAPRPGPPARSSGCSTAPAPCSTGTSRSRARKRTARDRPGALRRLLVAALAPGTVRWASHLRTLHPCGGGRHRAVFDDGGTAAFDLVVGADGTWSRVRPLLSDAEPHYCGVTFVEAGRDDVDTRHPRSARLVGRGTMMALSGGRGLLARRDGRGRIRLYAAFRGSQDWARRAGCAPPTPRRSGPPCWPGSRAGTKACWRCSGERRRVREPPAVRAAGAARLAAHPGLTLLGDAAHLMAPLSGPGVDLALADGCALARNLVEAHTWQTDPDRAVRAYEAALFPVRPRPPGPPRATWPPPSRRTPRTAPTARSAVGNRTRTCPDPRRRAGCGPAPPVARSAAREPGRRGPVRRPAGRGAEGRSSA
ncbi:FAD-dependent monooxygenase [Streptomyces albulus]|nr:FAD-dependent monooxygenase [Streptomyces noursei]